MKPDFFRHEKLQDLEVKNPGKYIMLVFEGLWGLCDSRGRFIFNPRMIKLDVLPFIPFDMEDTLGILVNEAFIEKYEVDGVCYGRIPTFNEHQRLSGKEVTEGEKYPDARVKRKRSSREASGKHPDAQEGKGREKEGNGAAPQNKKQSGKRVPGDFAVTPDMLTWASENVPEIDVIRETENFRDHEFASPKTDWLAAWRNWMRRSKGFGGKPASPPRRPPKLLGAE